MKLIPLLLRVTLLIAGAVGFLPKKENWLTHLSVRGLSNLENSSGGEFLADLYFYPNLDGTFKGIVRSLQISDDFFRSQRGPQPSEEELQAYKKAFISKRKSKPMVVKFNETGQVVAWYVGDREYWLDNRLYWDFYKYWGLLTLDAEILDGVRDNRTSVEHRATFKLDGNDRLCTKSHQIAYNDPELLQITTSIDSSSCQTDEELSSLSFPHAWGYNVTLQRSLTRNHELIFLGIYYELLDSEDSVSERLNVTAKFEGFVPYNERLFQPRARPLETPLLPVSEILPLRAGFDTKLHVSAEINDFDTHFNPQLDLLLRDSGNRTFLFGKITNLHFTNYLSHEDKTRYSEFLDPPFVFGLLNSSEVGRSGQLVYKFLNQDRLEDTVGNRAVYVDGIHFDPHVLEMLEQGRTFDRKLVQFAYESDVKCYKNYTIEGDKESLVVAKVSVNTSECPKSGGLYGSSRQPLRLVLSNSFVFRRGQLKEARFDFQMINDKYSNTYVDAKLNVTVEGYLPREDSDQGAFQLYGQPIDSKFFDQVEDFE